MQISTNCVRGCWHIFGRFGDCLKWVPFPEGNITYICLRYIIVFWFGCHLIIKFWIKLTIRVPWSMHRAGNKQVTSNTRSQFWQRVKQRVHIARNCPGNLFLQNFLSTLISSFVLLMKHYWLPKAYYFNKSYVSIAVWCMRNNIMCIWCFQGN